MYFTGTFNKKCLGSIYLSWIHDAFNWFILKKNTSRTIWNIKESKDHITIELEVKSASGVVVPVFWGTTMHVICMLFHSLADFLLFWFIMDRQITSTQASRWSRRVTVGATCALSQIPQRNTLEPGATQVHYFPYSLV